MPVETIDLIKGNISKEAQLEMMKRVSEVVAEIEARPNPKENMLQFVYCIIREAEWGNFGQNGCQSRQNCSAHAKRVWSR
jgi:phenylpyruvate tautomerase PptA (4-oxalocrotonate tautomerase family)